jgi:hypothetical protein
MIPDVGQLGLERVTVRREDPGAPGQQRPQHRRLAGPGDVVATSGEFRPHRDSRVDVASQRRDDEQDPAHPTGLRTIAKFFQVTIYIARP